MRIIWIGVVTAIAASILIVGLVLRSVSSP